MADEGTDERIALLDNKYGGWGCQTRFWCTKVYPKEIPVSKKINPIKKRISDSKQK